MADHSTVIAVRNVAYRLGKGVPGQALWNEMERACLSLYALRRALQPEPAQVDVHWPCHL